MPYTDSAAGIGYSKAVAKEKSLLPPVSNCVWAARKGRSKVTKEFRKTVRLLPQQKGTYVDVPFEVEPGVRSLTMRVEYPMVFPKCVVQPALYGPNGLRGCCAVQKTGCTVSAEFASPGFQAAPIEPGRWRVALSVAAMQEETEVSVCIAMEPEAPAWYKADLHLHSCHSDGGYTAQETVELCRDAGLDIIALTDHNSVTQNVFCKTEEGLLRMPGYEWTTRLGHANFIGVEKPVRDFASPTVEDAKRILREAHDNGALVVLNHPGDRLGGWKVGTNDIPFDAYEIWNGPWRDTNDQSLALWQEMLAQGRRIPAVGGSDTHKVIAATKHGHPCNHLYVQRFAMDAVLEAIRAGHCYLTRTPGDGPVELRINEAMMGDTAAEAPRYELHFEVCGLSCGDELLLISEQGLVRKWTASVSCERRTLEVPPAFFYRLEVRRPSLRGGQPIVITNPVYLAGSR